MNKILFSILLLVTANKLLAQTTELYVGSESNSLVLKSGATFSVAGLTLLPTSDIDLTNNQIIKSTSVTNTVNQRYIQRVFKFNSNTPSFTGTISFDYSGVTAYNTNETISTEESNFKLHYHNGTSWNRDGSSTVNTSTDLVTSSNLSAVVLNELTVSDVTTTLPVTWQSFTATKQPTSVLLNWSTASEQNTKDFEIQYSTNTQTWSALGTVAAAGSSTTARSYTFTHYSPLKGSVYNYYRIKQNDLDGKFSYSKIVSIVYNEPGPDVQLYPNPAKDVLHVYLAESQQLRIVNMAGATVWQGWVNAGRNQIAVSYLPKGVYTLITLRGPQQILIQ